MEVGVVTQRPWPEVRDEAVLAVANVFDRDCGQGDRSGDLASQLVGLLHSRGFDSPEAKTWLHSTGIGALWNTALDVGRPRSLAPHVTPLLAGRTADVLSGSGTLTAALARSVEIDAYERVGAYPSKPPVPTSPLEDLWSVGPDLYDTVLLCTVLHHEPRPAEFVDRVVAALRPSRLVIVENCLSNSVSHEFHDFMDDFYNITLNDFAVECPGQHRTVDRWLGFLDHYGQARFVRRLATVAGMPFPYEIFTVEVEPGTPK